MSVRKASLPLRQHKHNDKLKHNAGCFFWVNRSGLPLKEETWERMWSFAAKQHPDGENIIESIRVLCDNLPKIPFPTSTIHSNMSVYQKIIEIQKYIEALEYNYTGTQFFHIQKSKPLCFLMETAKEIMKECLPIKCLEAVILAVYMTNGIPTLERFSIGFKTVFKTVEYRHVVLGIYYKGSYGALGMSRREKLMYKPLVYSSLHELILNYQMSYKDYGHKMLKLHIGLPITHNPTSCRSIVWKGIVINMQSTDPTDLFRKVQKHARLIRKSGSPGRNVRKSNNFSQPKITFPWLPAKKNPKRTTV
ncbi:tubulinyl-Tyr carboxypeptidase 1-like [Octopus vulgaris]|uniref:Tubulinyl-Tyr carboxypeptidase 1-like n=2 Tax=Octopus TaxID=6643 RepID=A0AA36F9N6_OCTVU|nr:tubulinyl-Tyr carboxypeptidase 1-like isoform X1 [Octopus sinensis]CAI9729607.1 tubulinyl-Tyr carboxypeptidase 1-like [Octopus vulgaris]